MTRCTISGEGVLALCLPTCDPIVQDCPHDDLCLPDWDSFICVLDGSGDEGQVFDPCAYANACDPGFYCAEPELASECDPMSNACCLPLCDTDAPNACPGQGQECLAWFEEGQAPPGYENVGLCGLP